MLSPTLLPTATPRRTLRAAAVAVAAATLAVAAVPSAASAKPDPADLRPYYSIFQRGPANIPGVDTKWVPQGIAYWSQQNALAISYYDGDGKANSRLAIVDRTTGALKKLLQFPTKGHVGGLAMAKNNLFVATDGKVTRFSKSSLSSTKNLGLLKPTGTKKTKASSYATISGGALWVGTFTEGAGTPGTAYRYDLTKNEGLTGVKAQISTPSQVQGMAFAGGKIVYSSSYGRNKRGRLSVMGTGAPTAPGSRTIVAPNMSEGIVVAGGRLYVLYESGSAKYSNASYRVKTVHSAPVASVVR